MSLTVRLLSLCAFSRCAPSGLVDGVLPVPTRAQCCVVIWSTPHPPWTSLDQGCVGRVCDERVPSVAADDASKWNAKKPAIDALKASPMWDRSRFCFPLAVYLAYAFSRGGDPISAVAAVRERKRCERREGKQAPRRL